MIWDGICKGIPCIDNEKLLAEAKDGINEFTKRFTHICTTCNKLVYAKFAIVGVHH